MKKNILVLSLFAGVLANLLVSCSNDDETTNQALLEGKWGKRGKTHLQKR